MTQPRGAYEDARNPIVRAADRMIEDAEAAKRVADLSFDPLNYSGSGKAPSGSAVSIPEEWLMKMAAFNRVANPAAAASGAASGALSATQQRALRKLQQRRESRQAAVVSAIHNAGTMESMPQTAVPIDESWLEDLEQSVVKQAPKTTKKKGKKGKAAKSSEPAGSPEPQEDEGNEEPEEPEEAAPEPEEQESPEEEGQEEAECQRPEPPGVAENKPQPAKGKAAKTVKVVDPALKNAAPQEPPAARDPPAEKAPEKAVEKARTRRDGLAARSYAEIASWAAVEPDESEQVIEKPIPRPERKATTSDKMTADAPDFIPFSMMQPQQQEEINMQALGGRKDKRRGRGQGGAGMGMGGMDGMGVGVDGYGGGDPNSLPITTLLISSISGHYTSETFRQQLDSWGLLGTYNFFYMPPMDSSPENTMATTCCFVNFVDPTFASFCQFLFQQYPFEGTATPFHVQGLESNIAHFSQFTTPDMINTPLVLPTPTPSQMAVNGVNVMLNSKLSPQIRGQFHKTKLCVFNKKNKCALGNTCPFAHAKEELQATPDLAKTKLCYNFFRRRCNDTRCKFAHGYQELRATNNVYKTELCRWWSHGGCKAGNACRYAHGVEELRGQDYMGGMTEGHYEGMMQDFAGDFSQPYYTMGPEDFGDVAPGAWDQQQPPTGGLMVCGVNRTSAKGPSSSSEQTKLKAAHAPKPAVAKADDDELGDAGGEEIVSQWFGSQGDDNSVSEFGFSESAFSRQSTLQVADFILRRQQTAPPTVLPSVGEPGSDTIVLRVKGTFMEAVQLEAEAHEAPRPMRRSWSDGDLPQLSEVMEGMEDFDDI